MNIENFIREYLPNVIHLSLATSADNKPWVCEVHFAYDDDLNLYFFSTTDRRHCEELRNNKYVAGNIVKQHAMGEKPRGVYFEGVAEQLENVDENHIAYKTYAARYPEFRHWEKLGGDSRLYKIKVSDYYIFDVTGQIQPPGKHQLSWKK
ncbi:MAG: pyridoxamine 5'-phosphate oxidase family protein [Candidatus Saccharibacteria bacterium]|nr:pyridoxamine 5'-phosphate oxidase family protein [Candidatus Saccharibacteria bacterium]